MNSDQQTLKSAAKAALAALFVLLIGSVIFYKERILFNDSAFKLFNIIRYDSFSISECRYGSFVTQLFPYLGQKLHLPIEALLIGYSVSFNLFYLVVASLLVYRYKQYAFGIIMALYYTLLVSDSFFWANDEIHQAIAWMFLFFGVVLSMGAQNKPIILVILPFTLFSFLAVFTHFIVIIPMFFIWIYLWIEQKNWPFSRNISILLTGLLLAIVFVKYRITTSQSYDAQHLNGINNFSVGRIIFGIKSPVIHMFLYRCIINYWLGVIVFAAGIYYMLKNGMKLLAAWTLISCIGYFILMGLTYADYDRSMVLFHIETEWQSLSIIIALPFVLYFIPKLNPSKAVLCLTFIFIVRVAYICTGIPAFSWRTHFREEVLQQMRKKGISKLALINDRTIQTKYIQDWALPEESILSSAVKHDMPQLTFFFVDTADHSLIQALTIPDFVNLSFERNNVSVVHNKYFTLDAAHPYKVMTYNELFK